MNPTPPPDETDVLFYVLRRKRLQARLVLFFEQLWPALWPAVGLCGSFVILALLELPAFLNPWGRMVLLGGFAIAIAAAVLHGLQRLRAPSVAEADRRLERASGLRHRPLEVLYDRPVLPGADGLWRAHISRIRAQIARLRVGIPRPGLATRDRRALRFLVLIGLAAACGVAGEQSAGRIGRAFDLGFAPPSVAGALLLQAWITPPATTGLAPIFLKPEGGSLSVPAGAHLTINLSGGTARPALRHDGKTIAFQTLGEASFQLDHDLTASGPVEIRRGGEQVAAWDIAVLANVAPIVRFPEPPGNAGAASQPLLRLPWEVSHAYGVTGLQAEIRLVERPDLPALVVTVPLPAGGPKRAKGARTQDLTAHPWAGLKARAVLVGHDATGLAGKSDGEDLTLPERRFVNPVARALAVIRKGLTLHPAERMAPSHDIARIGDLTEAWKDDLTGYLNLRAIGYRLRWGQGTGLIEEIQGRLWDLALHVEEGAPERTARALEQARQDLHKLLDAEKRGEAPDQADLKQRLKDVQEALEKHLQALSEQGKRDPDSDRFNPDRDRAEARELERLTEAMKEAARAGRMDETRETLAELDRKLDAVQKGDRQRGKMTEQQKQRAEKRQQGERQVSAVQDMVKREGGLVDHAQSRDRPGFDPRRPGFGQRAPFPPPGFVPDAEQQGAERRSDQRLQMALRRALGALMERFGDLTGTVPPTLGEADMAMRDAAAALGLGRDGAAGEAELRAVAALQKGNKEMAEQVEKMFGQPQDGDDDEGAGDFDMSGDGDQPGDQPGEGPGDGPGTGKGRRGNQYGNNRDPNGRGTRPWGGQQQGMDRRDEKRDPLGRLLKNGQGGLDQDGATEVPAEMEQARTRAIQDELRRRGAERTRPKPELDYIDRLLKQF